MRICTVALLTVQRFGGVLETLQIKTWAGCFTTNGARNFNKKAWCLFFTTCGKTLLCQWAPYQLYKFSFVCAEYVTRISWKLSIFTMRHISPREGGWVNCSVWGSLGAFLLSRKRRLVPNWTRRVELMWVKRFSTLWLLLVYEDSIWFDARSGNGSEGTERSLVCSNDIWSMLERKRA